MMSGRILMMVFLCVFFLLPEQTSAVQPDEILQDMKLENRARAVSSGLRCLVCQNQSIDDSDAPLARDLRLLVRERLVVGDSNEDVVDFVVSRYGEFVLLKPRFGWHTALLWLGPLMFVVIGIFSVFFVLRKSYGAVPEPLSQEEKQRLSKVLGSVSE